MSQPTMQQRRADLLRLHLSPALRAAGLRKQGRRTWYEQRPNGGWVMIEVRSSKWSNKDLVEFWLETVCWPPGTWEFRRGFDAITDDVPFVAANAPLSMDSRPDRGEWALSAKIDLDALGTEVVASATEALARGRAWCDDLDAAVRAQAGPGHTWGLIDAVAMLNHAAPDDRRLPDLVEQLTHRWAADPRPIWLREQLLAWRKAARLPARDDLPTCWAPCMTADAVERYGSAQAAWRAGFGVTFTYADRSQSRVPPPGWLEQKPGDAGPHSGQDAVRDMLSDTGRSARPRKPRRWRLRRP